MRGTHGITEITSGGNCYGVYAFGHVSRSFVRHSVVGKFVQLQRQRGGDLGHGREMAALLLCLRLIGLYSLVSHRLSGGSSPLT